MTDAEYAALPEEIQLELHNAYTRGRQDQAAQYAADTEAEIAALRKTIRLIQTIVAD